MSEAAAPPTEPSPPELRSLARGGTLTLAGFVVSGVLGFALAIIVTRGLGTSGAGVFFSAVAVFTILSNVTELGADTGVVRFVSRFGELGRAADLRRMLRVALGPVVVAGVAAGIAMFFGADWLARVFVPDRQADTAEFIRSIAPFLPLSTVGTVALAATRGFGTMVPFVAVESVGKPTLKPAFVLAMVAGGLTTAEVAIGWGIPEGVGCVAAITVLVSLLRRVERKADAGAARSVSELAREFWRFSAPRGLAAAFQVTVLWFDVLLLGLFRPSAEVGVYAAASRVVTVGTFALQAIRLAIAPQVSAMLARDDRAGAQTLYQTATWWLMAVSWPLFFTLAVFAPFLLKAFGPEFPQGQTALTILALAMLVNLGTGNVTVVLLMGGKSSWNLVNTGVAITLNVGLNLWLIPRYGMEGAAVAWAVSIAVDNVLALAEVWRFLGMRPFGGGYAVVAGAAAACFGVIGLVVRWTLGMSVASFALFAVISTGVYLLVLSRYRRELRFHEFLGALRGAAGRPWRCRRPPLSGADVACSGGRAATAPREVGRVPLSRLGG